MKARSVEYLRWENLTFIVLQLVFILFSFLSGCEQAQNLSLFCKLKFSYKMYTNELVNKLD